MDERVVYPGQADREAAQAAALMRYGASKDAVQPPSTEPPIPSESPAQPQKQPELEPLASRGPHNKGVNRLGVGVLVLVVLGGSWWWKDQQDQRVQQAQDQAAQQALAAEAAWRDREAEKKRADEAEAQRAAAEKAQAQIAEQARRVGEAEKKRADDAEAQRVAAEKALAHIADQARREREAERKRAEAATRVVREERAAETVQRATQATPAAAPAQAAQALVPASDELRLMWPANGPVIYAFEEGRNKGLGIGGRAGDPVVSAAEGRVVYVGAGLRGYGNLIILKHNNTFLTVYAHNQALLVKEDQTVRQGQKIAKMGNSDAERVKLHFEVRRQGKSVDPIKYLVPR